MNAGRVTKTDYDELNRGWRTTDAKGRVTTTTFDNAGRAIRNTFHDGTTTTTTYDELNRAIASRDQLGKVRTMHYDDLGRMDWVEMPLDAATGKTLRTRFGFNELGQRVWQQDAKGVAEDKANGLDVNVAAPVSRVTRFFYDNRGRVVARQLPGTLGTVNGTSDTAPLIEAMEYDELGQVKRKRDFRGLWTSFSYDVRGRLIARLPDVALAATDDPITYEYPDEFTAIQRRGLVTTKQKYDQNRGWLESSEAPNGTLNYDHNAFGQMTGLNVMSGGTTRTTNYAYDTLSRLKTITSFNGGEWTYDYDEVGNKASLSRPNGITTNYDYDTLNRLKELVNVKGSGASAQEVSRFGYRLRADGRRDKLTETLLQPDGTTASRNIEYSFDDANRLTGEVGQDGAGKNYSKSYTLDEAGNRRKLIASQETTGGATNSTTTNYSYNDLDWMTQQSVTDSNSLLTTTNYDYDANGSQTGITTQAGIYAPTYVKQVWDFEGHLTARGAVNAQGAWGSSRNEYSYNAAGMRLSQSTVAQSGTTTNKTSYLWNGDRLLEERDKDGDLLARYEHGQELGPLSMLRPAQNSIAAQTRYFIGDGQDSTRQLTDETGAIKDSYFYDSFGVDLNGGQATSANSFKYTGQQQDASGLYYLRARFYDTGSGRFLSHDPVLGSSDDPITMHRYLYANVDPVNAVDPTGEFGDYSLSSVMSGMKIGATLGAVSSGAYSHFVHGNTGFALLRDVLGGAALGGLGGAAYPLLGSAIALNTAASLGTVGSQALAFWGATAGSGALTGAVSAAFEGGDLNEIGSAAGRGAVTSVVLAGVFKGGFKLGRMAGSRSGVVPETGSQQAQELDDILARAAKIAHDPAFLKGASLHDEALQNTFFELFDEMSKNARHTTGGGFAGALRLPNGKVVLAFGFGRNWLGGQPSDTTIRHELAHAASESIQVNKNGQSLFMMEMNTAGHDPSMWSLWMREEGLAWVRSVFTTGGARS